MIDRQIDGQILRVKRGGWLMMRLKFSSASFAAMPCTYIKKALCQKSKSKTDITSFRPSTTLHLAPAQVDIQNAKKLAETYFDTLCPDTSTTTKDKVERVKALYSKQLYKDTEEVVENVELASRQRQKCKAIGQIVFRFVLHDAQIEAIQILFYEQRDLLLMAKTRFGKSLIFQLCL